MIQVKPGVIFKRFRPEMGRADVVAEVLFIAHGFDCVITSANDGAHMAGSLHFVDLAHDYRTKHIPDKDVKVKIGQLIAEALGSPYDVILEDPGGENEHLHVEFDEKKKGTHGI